MRSLYAVGIMVVLVTVGCGEKGHVAEPATNTTMKLSSASFTQDGPIPEKYSAYGANVSPQLSWTEPPTGTKSLVLLVEDPDAPRPDPFVHWLIFNIPPTARSISEGESPPESKAGKNDANMTAYYGPKPPSGVHHYHFKVYAVDELLNLPDGSTKFEVMKEMEGHSLGMGELVGTYSH